MTFDAHSYGDSVAGILALDGDGQRPMALAQPRCTSPQAAALLRAAKPNELLPLAISADAAVAGLYLYFGCWAEAHEAAQNIDTTEGSYWHAIVHRQEPDAGNSE